MRRLIRMTIVAALVAPSLTQSNDASAQLGACFAILKKYVLAPMAVGASEQIGSYLVDMFFESQAQGEIPADVPPPSMAALAAPSSGIDESYIDYLRGMGFSDCQIRMAVERAMGPPPTKIYN